MENPVDAAIAAGALAELTATFYQTLIANHIPDDVSRYLTAEFVRSINTGR